MPIPTSGKWYWELHVDSYASGGGVYVGFGADASLGYDEVAQSKGVFMSTYNQAVDVNGSTQSSPYNSQGNNSTSNGDIYSFALDVDNQKFYVAKNGTYRGSSDPSAGTGGLDVSAVFTNAVTELTVCLTRGGSYNETYSVNFGQDSKDVASANADENGIGTFEYAPPSGFLALCSANLPQGAIDTLADETPEDYFNTLLWTGDGSNPRTLSGLDFAADFIWHKSRSSASMDHHAIQDVVRGFNTNNNLYTSLTGSETDYPNRGVINSVSSTGFTFNQNASDYSTADGLNQSGSTFVAWNWKAGGAGVSNTDGSISSSVSVGSTSQQSWFSIVGFTTQAGGYTVGHGLGQKPSLIITKNRDTTGGAWYTFTDIIDGSVDYLALNQTTAKLNDPFGMANPTSSVFSLDDDYIFGSGDCIAYCFANAEGLCKVGLYVGNGSSDGSFVYTGFRPAFVLTKKSSASGEWVMWDNRRSGYNVDNDFLYANTNNSEYNGASYPRLDLVSNGFKMRDNSADTNGSGATYIYLAIAEQPFKYANAR
jgi:hypothetical protein